MIPFTNFPLTSARYIDKSVLKYNETLKNITSKNYLHFKFGITILIRIHSFLKNYFNYIYPYFINSTFLFLLWFYLFHYFFIY